MWVVRLCVWRPKVCLGYCSGRTCYLDSFETGCLPCLALIHSAMLVSEQTLGLTSACHHAWLFMWGGVGTELRSSRLVAPSLQPHWAVCFLRGEALFSTLLLESWWEATSAHSRSHIQLLKLTSSWLRTSEPEDLYLNFYWERCEASKIVAFICKRRIDTPKAYFCLSLLHLEAGIYTTFLM